MQYANITVSDLNRADFVSQRDLSQQELYLAGGWGRYFRGGFAINAFSTKAKSFRGGFAINVFGTNAIGFGFVKTSFEPKAVSGTSVVKIVVK